MISLALLLGVRIVAAEHEAVAGEGGLLDAGQDRVVHTRLPGDGVPQPVQRVITLALNTKTGPETEAHACKEGGQLHHRGVFILYNFDSAHLIRYVYTFCCVVFCSTKITVAY